MALRLKLLNCRQGLASSTTGVTADLSPGTTAAKGWLIKSIFFFNHGSSNITVDLKIKTPTSTRMLHKAAFVLASGAFTPVVLEKELTLDLTLPEILHVVLTSGSGTPTADCVVTGVERDQ